MAAARAGCGRRVGRQSQHAVVVAREPPAGAWRTRKNADDRDHAEKCARETVTSRAFRTGRIIMPNGRIVSHPRGAPQPLTWTFITPDHTVYPHVDIRVEVYANLRELRDVVKRENAEADVSYVTSQLFAYCTGVDEYMRRPGGRRWRTKTCAIIRFARTKLGTETLTHEAFHATMRYAQRVGIALTDVADADNRTSNLARGVKDRHRASPEETLAGCHGRLCRLIVTALRREHGPRWI